MDCHTLERIYLMNVTLYLPTYFDIFTFIQINKKCFSAVNDLKVNPWLTTPFSILKFHCHFNPETINCCSFRITHRKTLEKCVFIRNPNFHYVDEEDKQLLIPFLSKVTIITFRKTRVGQSNFYIDNAIRFDSLKSIVGDLELVIQFCESLYSVRPSQLTNLKKIQIEPQSTEFVFPYKTLPLIKRLRNTIGINNGIRIILVSFYAAFSKQEINEFNKINVEVCFKMLTQCLLEEMELSYVAPGKVIAIEGTYFGDRFNSIIEKRLPKTCVLLMANNPQLKEEIEGIKGTIMKPEDPRKIFWKIPKCIKEMELSRINPVIVENTLNVVPEYPANFFYLKTIRLDRCRNIFVSQTLPHLKKIMLFESENVSICSSDEDNLFGLVKLKVLMIIRCNDISIKSDSPYLKEVVMEGGDRVYIYGTISSVKDFTFLRVVKAVLPYCSFENKCVNIQYCSAIQFYEKTIARNPMEFMGIGTTTFNELIKKTVILPLSVPNDIFNSRTLSSFFYMTPFFLNSERIKKNGNVLSMKSKNFIDSDHIDTLLSTQFLMAGKSDLLITVLGEHDTCSIYDASIHYFEITIMGLALMSIGLVDVIRMDNEHYTTSNRLVGMDIGTIGFYSETGHVFNESELMKYSDPYATSSQCIDTIGCGYNLKTKEVFFTKNGIKLQTIPFKCYSLSAVISIDFINKAVINYGNTPFIFDLAQELERNGFVNQLKSNCQIV